MRLCAPQRDLPLFEFTALMAMLSAITAFSTDAMLPGLGLITNDLSDDASHDGHAIVFCFFLGLGFGTLTAGPLSDQFGRRAVILGGFAVFISGGLLSASAWSFDAMLAGRMLQGVGLAGPRVASLALIRDRFTGAEMARVISLMMMVFVAVPASAPLIGSFIIDAGGWRALFVAFGVAGASLATWAALRQAETLDTAARRTLRFGEIADGVLTVLSIPRVCVIIAVQALAFAILFTVLASSAQIFDVSFQRLDEFTYWFGALSICTAVGGYLNAKAVQRLTMPKVIAVAFLGLALFSGGAQFAAQFSFAIYVLWLGAVFFATSFVFGNLNALGLEPLGRLAGLGTSILSASATCGGVAIAGVVGGFLDGGTLPPIVAVGICAAAGGVAMMCVPSTSFRWRDLVPPNPYCR